MARYSDKKSLIDHQIALLKQRICEIQRRIPKSEGKLEKFKKGSV